MEENSAQHEDEENVERDTRAREDTKLSPWQRYSMLPLPSTQSCVRTPNNLDMMHNSYEWSTGWRQKNGSDTSILWFISEIQMSVCCCIWMRHLHSDWQFHIFSCVVTVDVIDVMSCHVYHVLSQKNRQLQCEDRKWEWASGMRMVTINSNLGTTNWVFASMDVCSV